MSDRRESRTLLGEARVAEELQNIKHQMQFNLFFVALIFTTLSLSIQFSLKIQRDS